MMKTASLLIAGAAAISVLGSAPLALAQAKSAPAKSAPAKPAAAPIASGASSLTANVPGVCVLSREAILGGSTVGKYVQTRLGQLQSQANAELSGDATTLQNDAKSLETKKATLGDAAYQQQRAALQQRSEALQQKAQLRDRELQATEQKAVQHVLQEASPLVIEQAKAKNCGILLDANALIGVNPAMDLTQGVIAGLNTKLTQFPFDRENLEGQAAAAKK